MTFSSKYCASRVACSLSRLPTVSSIFTPPGAIPKSGVEQLSLISRPAGDVEHLPAHERGLLGGEVQDGGGHVLGPPRAADGDGLYALGDEVVEIHAQAGRGLAGHLRRCDARGDVVHGDPVAAELDGEGLGEALDARLRRSVIGLAAVAQRARR